MAPFDTFYQRALIDVYEPRPLSSQNDVDTNKLHNNNPFVKLNVLPAEILSLTLLLTGPPTRKNPYPYLPLTWVCHYWRSLLIHNPIFWTTIKLPYSNVDLRLHPFVQEIILRSKAMELDALISYFPSRVSTTIQPITAFLTSHGNRIRDLWLSQTEWYIDHLTFSNKMFSSLRQLIFDAHTFKSIDSLLQILATSGNLDVFQCKLPEDVSKVERLAPTFQRVRKLVITIPSPHTEFARSIIASLHDSPKLQNLSLRFNTDYLDEVLDKIHIILPELLILWSNCLSAIEQFRAPRLSLLDIIVFDSQMLDHEHTIFADFNFSSTKHLYVKQCYEGYCISGSKYSASCKTFARENALEGFQDVLPYNWPQDCFHLKLDVVKGHSFSKRLQDVLLAVQPRLTNLTSLYLSIPDSLYDLEQLLTKFPLIEVLIIDDGDHALNFIDLLCNTSLCRCLKELSYTTYWIPRDMENFAENLGRELTECLQSRKKDDAHQLKSIYMDNCPPLSKTWLEELRKLGTEIMTAKDIQSVKRRTQLLTIDQ